MGWLDQYKKGGMIKRADGSYSQRGLWDNIRANAGSGKKPTKEMLKQEKKIRAAEKKEYGGWLDEYQNGGYSNSGAPKAQYGRPVNSKSTDSLSHLAGQMMDYEAIKGSPIGTPLSNWGYHQSQLPYNQVPSNWTPPQTKQEAVDMYMKEIAGSGKLDYYPSAMEKAEAGDFLYNTGRDARAYMIDQYLKSKGQPGISNRGSYNVDTKSPQWTPELQNSLDQQWNQYQGDIMKLPTNDRRILLNRGRDFYYQNINRVNGQPNPSYETTWKPRIWESVNYYKKHGGYSTTGYKADSPDRNNPYNIIPSGRITMQNVPHPVMGIDNYGNAQYMVPGGEYQFQGDQVFEVPAMKSGGTVPTINDAGNFKDGVWVPDLATIKQQAKKLGSRTVKTKSGSIINFDENWNIKNVNDAPTMQGGGPSSNIATAQDSLDVYNNAKALLNYYRSRNYREKSFPIYGDAFDELDNDNKEYKDQLDRKRTYVSQKGNRLQGTIPYTIYHQDIDKNKFKQRESANSILDTRAPMALYDRRIKPNLYYEFDNRNEKDSLYLDAVNIYSYDPIMVKPYSLLTPEEKKIRNQRYPSLNQRQQPVLQQTKTQVPIKQRELVAPVPVTDMQQYPVNQQGQQYMIPAPIPASPYDINVHQWDPALLGKPDQVKSFMTKEQLEDWKKANQAHYLQGNRYEVGMNQVPSQDGAFTGIEQMKQGGIPQRYKNMGFTRVGQKKTGDGQHKWKVLAKKGDSYKVVQGGYRGMQDFKQHGSQERRDRFWDRMGGRDSAKAKDPFSPLYWHKRFGTWEYGGPVEMQDGGPRKDLPKNLIPATDPYQRSHYDHVTGKMYLTADQYNNPDVYNHESFHEFQDRAGRLSVPEMWEGPLRRPAMVASDELQGAYFNRQGLDANIIANRFFQKHPDFQFVSPKAMYEKYIDAEKYRQPWTVEGEAVDYENYMHNKQMQGGGVAPYITHNLNDPRIQSYKDSTDLYNLYKLQEQIHGNKQTIPTSRFLNTVPSFVTGMGEENRNLRRKARPNENPRFNGWSMALGNNPITNRELEDYERRSKLPFDSKGILDIGDRQLINAANRLNNSNVYTVNRESPDIYHRTIKPIGYYEELPRNGQIRGPINHIYKKPEQEVIYQPITTTKTVIKTPSKKVTKVISVDPVNPINVIQIPEKKKKYQYIREDSHGIRTSPVMDTDVVPEWFNPNAMKNGGWLNQYQFGGGMYMPTTSGSSPFMPASNGMSVVQQAPSFLTGVPEGIDLNTKLGYMQYLQDSISNESRKKIIDKPYNQKDPTIILNTGNFRNAKVNTKVIDDAIASAKKKGIPLWQMIGMAGQETTLGTNRKERNSGYERPNTQRNIVSGWNTTEPVLPEDFQVYMAGHGVPGVKAIRTDKRYIGTVTDPDVAERYLQEHPRVIDSYRKSQSLKIPKKAMSEFDYAASFLKEKGIKNYNPEEKNYSSEVNKRIKELSSDPAFMNYVKQKGYNLGEARQYEKGGWLSKYK